MGKPYNRYQVDDGAGKLYKTFANKTRALQCALEYARRHNVETWVLDGTGHKGKHNLWRYSFVSDQMIPQEPMPF